jgi:hypothetical protein
MRNISLSLLLVSCLVLPACAKLGASQSSAGSGVGISATDIATQADGVATALANLPAVPADEATAKQLAGYVAWAQYLAKAAATVATAVAGS